MSEKFLVYVVAGAIGMLYGIVVAIWRHYAPDGGATAFAVVIGNLLVTGIMALLWGLEVAASLVLVLVIMGTPQIVGYQIAYTLRERHSADERELR